MSSMPLQAGSIDLNGTIGSFSGIVGQLFCTF